MKLKYCKVQKLIRFSLLALVVLFSGCSGDAVPAAAIPAPGSASEEPPEVTGFDKSSEVTPTLPPQADGSVLTPLPAPISVGITPSAQSSVTPSPTPGMISGIPAVSVTPPVTAVPSPVAEAGTKSKELVYPIDSFKNDSVLCLTFDDGGNKKAIQKALEVLEQYDIQCTFFVIGKYLKPHAELWKQAIEQGHQICNHTQNHKWLSELSSEEVKKEILDWEASAADILGEEYVKEMKEKFPYLRLPGGAGSKSKRVLGILSELGYTPVGWNIESYYAVLRLHDLDNDPLADIADEVTAHITKGASGGSIILLHFNPYDTTKLDAILEGILAKKLTMELLSEQSF